MVKYLKNQVESVNTETGEITVVEKTFGVKIEKQEEFYMTFIQNMAGFFKLRSVVDIKLIVKLCQMAEFNTGKVTLAASTRLDLCNELCISNQQITNAIKSLKQKDLLQGDKGVYMINAMVFWKGDNQTREKLVKSHGLEITMRITE